MRDADHDVLPAPGQLVARRVSAHHGEVSRPPLAAPLQACRRDRDAGRSYKGGLGLVKWGYVNWTSSRCDSQPRDHVFQLVHFPDLLDYTQTKKEKFLFLLFCFLK